MRDLLDRLPDKRIPMLEVKLPPVSGKLSREKFGVVKPIKNYPV